MDTREKQRIVSFVKKKQGVELNAAEHLVLVRLERKPIRDDVKQDCIKLAQKYFSENAKHFFASLPATSGRETDDDDDWNIYLLRMITYVALKCVSFSDLIMWEARWPHG